MKKPLCLLHGAVLLLSTLAVHADIPADQPLPLPTYGWNLGNTLEATWGVPNFTAAPFTSAAAGFNAVRIPCAWDFNSNTNTYQIDPAFMARVKQAVDWAIAEGMYVVLNDHWDGGWMENNIGSTVDPTINEKMNSYWTQIATAFADYDNHLLFAGANEPNVHNLDEMKTLQVYYQTFIDAVRGTGGNNTNRWLVLQGGGETAWFDSMPTDPTPNRLMVEFHCYSPSQFAIISEDASWGIAKYYWGPAYHYDLDPTRNCVAPEEGAIDSGFQQLVDQFVSKGIPVMIGEFGVAGKPTTGEAAAYSSASSLYWIKYVAESAQAHGLSPFNWSTPSSLFNWETGATTNPDAVSALTGGAAPPPPNGAPYAVTGLVATNTGTGQIDLSWNAVGGATSYSLYRAAESGYECDTTPFATGITGTYYSDTGLNNGTTYYYQIVAVNGSGPSGFAIEAHATTSGTNPDPTQYHFETDTQRWTASGSQISGVATSTTRHYAGNQSLAVNFNGTAGGTSSVSLDDVAIPAGATATFHVWIPAGHKITTVEPWLQDRNWSWSQSWYNSFTANAWNTFTLTVPSDKITPMKVFGIRFTTAAAWTGTCYVDSVSWNIPTPSAPAGLAASPLDSAVALSWNWVGSADSYTVKRATVSGGSYTTIATGVTRASYQDTGLSDGTTYYYVVSALNATGASANSTEANATPGTIATPIPTGLAAVPGDAQVSLSWNASDGADSYVVKRSTTSGAPYETVVSNVVSTSYTDTDVSNGTTYFYVVSAVMSAVESANSTEANAKPASMAPTALYAFEGNAQDTSGNGNNGTANALSYVAGHVGAQAAQFNGTSSYVSIPRSIEDDFTVAMWVKTTDSAGTAGSQWWNGKGLVDGEVGGGGADWGTAIVNGKFVLGVGSGGGDTTIASSVNINDGAWHHLAATRDNASGAMKVYVDGVLSGSGTGPTGSRTWPANLRIGGLLPGNNYLNGTLDDVRLYDRILTVGEISAIVTPLPAAPAAPEGLAAVADDGGVDLSWSASATATGYQVKRSTTSGSGYATIASTNGLSLADTGVANGTLYYYVVSATNAGGESADSDEVGARPTSFEPVQIGVVLTNNQIQIDWPADHTGWNLEYKTDLLDTNGWILVPGSDATNMLDMGTLTNGSVFYRLVYP